MEKTDDSRATDFLLSIVHAGRICSSARCTLWGLAVAPNFPPLTPLAGGTIATPAWRVHCQVYTWLGALVMAVLDEKKEGADDFRWLRQPSEND